MLRLEQVFINYIHDMQKKYMLCLVDLTLKSYHLYYFCKKSFCKLFKYMEGLIEMTYIIRSAGIEITNKCNFRCKHCFNRSGEHNRNDEMTDSQILDIFQSIAKLQPDSMCICGGEPMLRKNLVYQIGKLVKTINSNISLNMVSNGSLIGDTEAKMLKDSGLDLLQISLDGASDETHNWIRNNNYSFKKAIEAIKLAKKYNLQVSVACTPSQKNYNEIFDVIKLCTDLGVSTFRIQPLMIMGRGTQLLDFTLSDEQYFKLSKKIMESASSKYKSINIEWGDPLQHLEAIVEGNESLKFKDLQINAYGDIMFSPYIPIMLGNLKKHSIIEYFDRGLEEIYTIPIIRNAAMQMKEWNNMELNQINKIFPKIGFDKNINFDLIEKENNDTELLNALETLK